MTTEKRVYYDKVTVTLEERELIEAVYKMVMEIAENTENPAYRTYNFSTMLDIIMSDIIDADETDIDGDYVVDLKEYYE